MRTHIQPRLARLVSVALPVDPTTELDRTDYCRLRCNALLCRKGARDDSINKHILATAGPGGKIIRLKARQVFLSRSSGKLSVLHSGGPASAHCSLKEPAKKPRLPLYVPDALEMCSVTLPLEGSRSKPSRSARKTNSQIDDRFFPLEAEGESRHDRIGVRQSACWRH
jgi:hypothetical protein